MISRTADQPVVLSRLRRFLLLILIVGIVGSGAELLLLEHHEDAWQFVPLALDVAALAVICLHVVAGGRVTVRALQLLMTLFLVSGALGVWLHYQGNLEFQLDMDPTLPAWDLFSRVMRAKAPPALAPGVMAQLGLLGLAYCYRHPALTPASGAADVEPVERRRNA
jgi:hypothetical protein